MPLRPVAVALLGGLALAAPAVAATTPFAYSTLTPLDVQRGEVVNPGYPIPVRDVSYRSPLGGRVKGYLLVPPGAGRRPAVVYLHGSGGDRLQLVPAAAWMAARGVVTLTIEDATHRHPISGTGLARLRAERDVQVQTIVDLRRAVDLLRSLPQVDPKRIGFVGWSAGARSGAILAGVDHRVRAFALISGGAAPIQAYVDVTPARFKPAVRKALNDVDPLRWVTRSAPSAMLFLDGTKDTVVPRSALVGLSRRAGQPKTVRWYTTGHSPSVQEWRDQLKWLSGQLGVKGPAVRGAATGP